jgi:hypothetical protein
MRRIEAKEGWAEFFRTTGLAFARIFVGDIAITIEPNDIRRKRYETTLKRREN